MAGVYVHLPFCPYVCPYCDFAKWPHRRSAALRYLSALEAEIAAAPAFAAKTLFLGGGTPNVYPAADIARLVARLRTRFSLGSAAEVTIELNPDLSLCEEFAAYVEAGINRFSFGVQSFVDAELAALGRQHRGGEVVAAVDRARIAGISNLSVDLMFGIPGQTVDSWKASLAAALELEPQHVSTYGLTIEDGTPFSVWHAREPAAFPDSDREAELFSVAIDRLEAAGFEHYEISNFARSGFRSQHNANYWANGPYLGLGVGAASYLDGTRSVHTRAIDAYCDAALGGSPIPGTSEHLEGAARTGEAAMLALRTSQGVDVASFAERYGIDFLRFYEPVLAEMSAAGVLEVNPAVVRLTRRGRFLANDVCAAFIAPA
jgi:oxygen-independent coproporphyrinogen-3 oxidase